MRGKPLLAALGILTGYVVVILGWLSLEGATELNALLFFVLGLPVAATALWWSGRGGAGGAGRR
jgi:hypothetical protein